jgi:hypothetical protein
VPYDPDADLAARLLEALPSVPPPVAGKDARALSLRRRQPVSGAHTQTGDRGGAALFLVGCVRSGTTLTRDLLRRVPGVICPEETHFLRWSEPFRTPASMPPHTQNQVLRRHREIDGVPEEVFARLLRNLPIQGGAAARPMSPPSHGPGHLRTLSLDRQDTAEHLRRRADPGGVSRPRLLHIVRNPLNVVASMLSGRQVAVPDLHGAINYWCEAVQIAATLRKAAPDRIMDLRYEDLVADVPGAMAGVLRLCRVPAPAGLYQGRRPSRTEPLARGARPGGAAAVVARCGALARTWLRPGGLRRYARVAP